MGGGGAAGKIGYPEYISIIHGKFLDHEGVDEPDKSITDAFNTALTYNPFLGELAFSPDIQLDAARRYIDDFVTQIDYLMPLTRYEESATFVRAIVDRYTNDTYIHGDVPSVTVDDSALAADAEAYAAIQNYILENTILPPWKAGMHNINAVTSSAFVIGEAILRAMNQADIAKYTSGVRSQIVAKNAEINGELIKQREDMTSKYFLQRHENIRLTTDHILRMLVQKSELRGNVSGQWLSYAQLHIASKYDENDAQLTINESDAKWELGLYQHVGQFIGAMGGGSSSGAAKRPSRAASIASGAIGGAISGAMVGSVVPGIGTAIGAVAGAALGAGMGALQSS